VERLNTLTRTRFRPPPVSKTVSIDVPETSAHDQVTATETITKTVIVVPEPVDIVHEQEFRILYTRTGTHLLWNWAALIGFGLLFSLATAIALRQQDVG
jgi:hypothetical protein